MNNRNARLQLITKFTQFKKRGCQKQLLHNDTKMSCHVIMRYYKLLQKDRIKKSVEIILSFIPLKKIKKNEN